MKVYVLTKGYNLIGIYAKKKEAEKERKRLKRKTDTTIIRNPYWWPKVSKGVTVK